MHVRAVGGCKVEGACRRLVLARSVLRDADTGVAEVIARNPADIAGVGVRHALLARGRLCWRAGRMLQAASPRRASRVAFTAHVLTVPGVLRRAVDARALCVHVRCGARSVR
jgi:hypothetical protein